MKRIHFTIQGISPLLMHRFPMEPIVAIEKKPKEEQAEIAAYRTTPGDKLYVSGVALQRALVNGAVYEKGRGRASLQKSVAASVFVEQEYLILDVQEYVIDSRPVVIKATGGRIIRHRPRLDKWEVSGSVLWDETLVTDVQLRAVFDHTGSRVGLLDFRPACKGPFGRFMITKWDVE